jgi:hypothetical protein
LVLTTARKISRKHKTQLAEEIDPKAERNAKVLTRSIEIDSDLIDISLFSSGNKCQRFN